MAVLLWCAKCGQEAVINGEVPIVCPACRQVTEWSTMPPYRPTEQDEKFLARIHVKHGKTD